MLRFARQEVDEFGRQEELLPSHFDLAQDADVGQGLQVDGRGLAVTQTGLDDILDSAIRLNENEFDEL